MNEDPRPVTPPSTVPEKKGIPPLGWVGIGCGALLLILLVVFLFAAKACSGLVKDIQENPERAAAELTVKMSPELEKVRTNDETGEITVRNKETGEETTFSYAELKKGNFKVTGADGSVTEVGKKDLSAAPEWLPLHDKITEGNMMTRQKSPTGETGTLMFKTATSVKEISEEYQTKLKETGYDVTETMIGNIIMVGGKNAELNREISVQIMPQDGATQVALTYSEKK